MSTYAEDELLFFVNGKKVVEKNPDPEVTLLQYLRDNLRLTGAKLGCGEGGCGACTVMVSKYDRVKQHIHHLAVNACLAPLCSMHGLAVTTTEAIGDTKTRLHPVQERLAKSHGSQCGFCTPGMVMSMYTLLRNNPCPSTADVENAFEGNLCRCAGYRPILDAFRSFTKEFQCPMGEECCKNNKTQESTVSEEPPMEEGSELLPYDPSQEPIFPSELQLNEGLDKTRLTFSSDRVTWYRPTSLDDLLTLKSTYPKAELVTGNTEAGVGWKSKFRHYPVVIAVTKIPQLLFVERTAAGVRLGASTTLTTLKEILQELVSSEPEYKTRVYAAIIEMLRWFAGKQVRNVGSIGGSIITASPISDLNPLFLSARCQVTVASKDGGQRTVVMDEEFFHGYRKTLLKPDEVLLNILIPFTRENEYFEGYKQAHRRQDDIAIVNAGMRVLLEDEGDVIKELSLSYGGMDAHTVMVTSTAGSLVGKIWDDELIPEACDLLATELSISPGLPGGMESYRNTLSLSFFFKFYLTVQTKRDSKQQSEMVPPTYQSATSVFERQPGCGSQVYEEVEDKQQRIDPVGRALPHLAATQQTTGEATYVDDIRPYAGELSLAFVISSKAHARLISVDASDALQMPGVVDFISYKDVPGDNCFGVGPQDQQVFAVDKVMYQGQIIGAIVAETRTEAIRATKAVVVKYEELTPILTIQQAIDADSFLRSDPMTIRNGDVAEGFKTSDVIIEGEAYVGGQEHFYLEMQSGIAVPSGEDDEITMLMATQFPNRIQQAVAATLGVPRNRIVCRAKRLGGGFGGKLTNTALVASPLAVAANKLQRPVRCYLDRDDDMVITGSRHPFLGKYKVGLTKAGMIQALELDLYSNCGCASDLSVTVMERAMFNADNSYRIPNIVVRGHLCKTNLPANTAMRGAGTPQGLFIAEHWMEKAAQALDVSSDKTQAMKN
ncbi:Xanthine dehydrogenase/oxidase [Lamellibrachia satsuma]|nr:Xanthine dehydrogenase/oxidase [Lamellibrachia satsuma]